MDVTVAICTWNRCQLLGQTLERLRQLRVPQGLRWELVVVDNNCTDATQQVLARYAQTLPLRAVVEPKQGHSHARNRAVAEARGQLLFWTDDDVLIDSNWLAELAAAAGKYPSAQFFGGPVRPWFESPPPRWIEQNLARLGSCWALLDHGPQVRWLRPGEYAYGANLGFRTATLRHYPFDPGLGRVGKRLTSGDETRIQDQVRAAGGEGVWVGTAAVEHFLPAERMTPRYVREILHWSGYLGHEPFVGDTSPRFRGVPRWMWSKYLSSAAKRRVLALSRGPSWVNALADEAKFSGLMARLRELNAPARAAVS